MTKLYRYILFAAIVSLAMFLRFVGLGAVPDGLNQDETSIGYNAYSILLTGKDEHGVPWPQNFKAFGEYKLPGYIYASVIPIKVFGLTPFAVRFSSAVAGVVSVVAVYFLALIFTSGERERQGRFGRHLPFVAMFLLAINPWNLHFSRVAYEVSLASAFVLTATVLFLWGVRQENRALLVTSIGLFALSMYTYNIARAFVPLFGLTLILTHWPQLKKYPVSFLASCAALAALLLAPFFIGVLGPGGANSTKGTVIFTSAVTQSALLEFRSFFVGWPAVVTKLFMNTWILTAWQYANNIVSFLSTSFFFVIGAPGGNNTIGTTGQWYLFEFPFVLMGIYLATKSTGKKRILLPWAGLVVLVASLTREVPSGTRSFLLNVPVTVCSSIGLVWFLEIVWAIRRRLVRAGVMVGSAAVMAYFVFLYFASYWVRFPVYYARDWRTGDRDVSAFLAGGGETYGRVVFDKKSGFMYSSLLFYTAYPPDKFQKEAVWSPDDSEGFSKPESFGRYEFREIDWKQMGADPGTLVIVGVDQKPSHPYKTFYYPTRPVVFASGQTIWQYPVQDVAYHAIVSGQ